VLIRSLEKNIPQSQIWQCLVENGITLDKLQKEWKKKALFFIGKAQLKRGDYADAQKNLEDALGLIEKDPKLATQIGELRELIGEASLKDKKAKQKEKAVWARAFQKNKEGSKGSMYAYEDASDHKLNQPSMQTSTSTSTSASASARVGTPRHSPSMLFGGGGEKIDPLDIKIDLSDLGLKGSGSKKYAYGNDKKDKSAKGDKDKGDRGAVMKPFSQDIFDKYGIFLSLGVLGLIGGSFWLMRGRRN
jgi:hypothetical protein